MVKETQEKHEVQSMVAMNEVRAVITAENCNNYIDREKNCDNCARHNIDNFDYSLP